MLLQKIATYHCEVGGKFGLPRQAGLASALCGRVVLEAPYSSPDALRGLEGYDFLWLIWGFHLNRSTGPHATVRPPRLGGNTRMGVFATRSPYRPNPLGLSSVRIESVDFGHSTIEVSGADLADGTPIYDIKPYVAYADSHPDARGGFTDSVEWQPLQVQMGAGVEALLDEAGRKALAQLIAQDPRPAYKRDTGTQDSPERIYRLSFMGRDFSFRVLDGKAEVFIEDPSSPAK